CTSTCTVQVALPPVPRAPPARLMLPVPAVAVTVPPQVLVTLGVPATCSPLGNGSVNATPLSATVFAAGFVSVNVVVVVAFRGIVAAPNALAIVGGAATATLAVAVLPVPPLVELTLPLVLVVAPVLVPVTVTGNWQLLLAAMLPPARLMTPVAAVVVTS